MPVGGGGKRFSAVGRMQLLQKAAEGCSKAHAAAVAAALGRPRLSAVCSPLPNSALLQHCQRAEETDGQTETEALPERMLWGSTAVDSSVLYSQPAQSTSHRQAVQVPNIKVRKRKSPSPGNHVGSSVSALLLS